MGGLSNRLIPPNNRDFPLVFVKYFPYLCIVKKGGCHFMTCLLFGTPFVTDNVGAVG